MTIAHDRAIVIFCATALIAIASAFALTPIAEASTGLPATICNAAGGLGSFAGMIGCASTSTNTTQGTTTASSATGTPFTDPIFDFSITGQSVEINVHIPNLPGINASTTASSTSDLSFSQSFPIDSPVPLPLATCQVKVVKQVVGGTASSSDFSIHLAQNGSDVSGSPQPGSVNGSAYKNLYAGSYQVSESGGPAGYTPSYSGDCTESGGLNLSIDQSAICTITNTFATSTPGTGTGSGTGTGTGTATGSGTGTGTGGMGTGTGGSGTGTGGAGTGSGTGTGGGGGNGPPVASSGGGSPSPSTTPTGTLVSPESAEQPGIPNTGSGGQDIPLLTFSAMLALLTATLLVKRMT